MTSHRVRVWGDEYCQGWRVGLDLWSTSGVLCKDCEHVTYLFHGRRCIAKPYLAFQKLHCLGVLADPKP